MKLDNATVLVTGANRGIGLAFAKAALVRGAQRVTNVFGVLRIRHAFVDTGMTQGIHTPKSTPEHIVARAYDALEAGVEEVLAEALTQQVKLGLAGEPAVYLQARG